MTKRSGLYSAFWRWHFYAGLLTLPVLTLLAVTGGLYLFKDEITNVVYARLIEVEPGVTAPLSASRIVAAAAEAVGGRANQLLMLAACLAILVMTVAAAAMWWKRRPIGSLGAPPLPEHWRTPRAILFIAIAFGILFPLPGLSLLVALAVDLTVVRRLAGSLT